MHQRHEPTTKTKSAALLAAEAAFAPPRQTTERLLIQGLPAITVIRAKLAAVSTGSANSNASAASDAAASREIEPHATKVPRVFLLKPAHTGFEATPPETPPQREVHAEEAAAPLHLDRTAPSRAGRTRRSRNRPPPVTLVFCAVAAADKAAGVVPDGELSASLARAQDKPPTHSLASLAAALAAMEPVFASIRTAMSFTVEDPEVTAQWEHLSRQLDQIAFEIRASSAKATAV